MTQNKTFLSILFLCVRKIFKVVVAIFAISILFGLFYWFNNNLSSWEARILWPQKPFSSEAFKSGSEEDRAHMVVDLISSQVLLQINYDKVTDLLGDETGDYYVTDSNFTYRLTNRGNADWILTLVPGNNGKIEKVFIRKSCCSVSHKILNQFFDSADPVIRWLF